MKIALLADIHGNALALETVLHAAREANVEHLLIAGDIVGYYYAVQRVLELLADWPWIAVRGNHENMLIEWMAGLRHEEIRGRYGSGLKAACESVASDQLQILCDLPPVRTLDIGGRRVLLCHGTPMSTDTYIYPDADESSWLPFVVDGVDMTVYGHTHYPMMLRRGGASIVNPGSVGQTRDRKPGACWALWDSQADTVEMRRETYDPSELIVACQDNDPDLLYLTNVLTRTI